MAMERLALHGGRPVSDHKIPISKPLMSEEEVEAVREVLLSGHLREGEKARQFEEEFKRMCGAKHAIVASSGTAALHLAFLALRKLNIIKPGDEVILPSFTFAATANVVIMTGCKPVFADIDERTFTMDPDDVVEKLTDRTRVLEPVHLYGQPADVEALLEIAEDHKLYVVWDAAQAHGAKYKGRDVGSFDHLVCYSFYATKNMTTGEGGMVTTNDDELARTVGLLKTHGQVHKYWHEMIGLNYRMTEMQAAIGLCQLRKLEKFNQARIENARVLTEGLSKIDGVMPPYVRPNCVHVFHQYTITLELEEFKCSRDEFARALEAEGIGVGVHYPTPVHKQPAYREIAKDVRLPITERIAERVLSLPVHPALSREDLEAIIHAVEKVATYYHR